MLRCIVFMVFVTLVTGRSTATTSQNALPEEGARSQETSYLGDLKYIYKIYQECSATELTSCLKLKLITAMDRAAKSFDNIEVIQGLSFVKNNDASNEISNTNEDIEATLPRALGEKNEALNNIIFDKITSFFDTHTLQVKLPSASELQRSLTEESRGKKKKMSGLMLIPLILGGTLIPLALGALALLAGKALIVSKLALVLAGIIGLKKLLGGGSSHQQQPHEIYAGGHSSGYGRSYDKEDAQSMAYNAYQEKPKST
nr:uncharacterized protein LOC111427597 [Onthophagus taurus]